MNTHWCHLSSAQIYMKRCDPTCWEAHVESWVPTICSLIRHSTDTFGAVSHITRLTSRDTSSRQKRRTKPGEMNWRIACWCNDSIFYNSLWWTVKDNIEGRLQRLCLWVKYSFHKSPVKHDRSNTGLNAFSSFPIFPFQHIRLVSALSRLCNGKLLQKHFSVSKGSRGHHWCHSQSNQWQIGLDMCSPTREWDRTAPLALRLISHRK